MSYKADRTAEDIKREITLLITELKDPRLNAALLTVVRTEVAHDLSFCKVYISSLQGIADAKAACKVLESGAKGYIRRSLGKRMIIRYSPELIFVSDKNIEYGVHIAKVLADAAGTEGQPHGSDERES